MIVAIDPGSSGGIVWEHEGVVGAEKMPDTDTGKVELLKKLYNKSFPTQTPPLCVMEKNSGFVGKRKVTKELKCYHCGKLVTYEEEQADPASAMYTFGDGSGFTRGIVITLNFKYQEFTPVQWMNAAGIRKERSEAKTAWKNRLKDRAQKLFPQIKVTLNTADALCILDVAKRIQF